ncbi:protein translocase subunit SecDF, partial [Staphylococcus aureus]|nr:protein translocase subunit SecDF [Staphylococcus aureus]
TMLLLGILMIFVTAVFLSRFLLSLLVSSNIFKNQFWLFGVKKNKRHDINEGVDVHDLKTSFEKWNFVKLAKPLIGVSILIVV